MMDFDNILDIATQNQGFGSVQKRYSLQAGPPKKDPKSKGVNPAAVEALLKKQKLERKKKEMEMKKQKDVLFAKRVELKSDRKARAMASRTKDNFKGYNGVPMVEATKKRRSDLNMHNDQSTTSHGFRNTTIDPENDEDNYEYDDSESEQEPEPLRPGKSTGDGCSSNKSFSKKPKPAPPPLNFADLLKLAEKKQHEPVDLKPKVVRKEERLRTADEIKEEEMERRAKRLDKHRDSKTERERDTKPQAGSNLTRTTTLEKEQKISKPQKNLLEKQTLPSGLGKKSQSDRGQSSFKSSIGDRERERPKISQNDRDRSKSSSSSSAINSKGISKSTSSQVSIKQGLPKSSSSHRSSTLSDLSFKKESSSSFQGRSSGIAGTRPQGATVTGQKSHHGTSHQTTPSNGGSFKEGAIVGGSKSRKGEPLKTGIHVAVKSSSNAVRNSPGGPSKAGSQPQPKPGGKLPAQAGGAAAVQARPGGSGPQRNPGGNGSRPPGSFSSRPGSGGPVPVRSSGPMGSGPGRPKCTVVSETISSKNVGGHKQGGPPRPGMPQRPGMPPRPGMPQRPGMPPRPGMPQRPGMPPRPGMPQSSGMPPRPGMPQRPLMNRPPGPMLPPITSAYKRKYEEEEEYDSEMDDFIDDGGDEQEEISRHIKEIFGYDRNKYKDESDYALKFMESSWKDVQKEEARSLKMAVQEDLEEERREEEEIKRKTAKRKKFN